MKYRTTQSFIAFGKVCNPGDVVELNEEQAKTLTDMGSVTDYETKVMPLPENKSRKKSAPSESLPAAPVAPKKTRKALAKKSKR